MLLKEGLGYLAIVSVIERGCGPDGFFFFFNAFPPLCPPCMRSCIGGWRDMRLRGKFVQGGEGGKLTNHGNFMSNRLCQLIPEIIP